MADTYNKKEREKKRERKKKEKAARKQERKEQGTQGDVIMYVDYNGNFTENKPEGFETEADISLEEIQLSIPKEEDNGMSKGRVKFFNEEKQFGFINGGAKIGDIYFSGAVLDDKVGEGDRVEFVVQEGDNGPYAAQVKKV